MTKAKSMAVHIVFRSQGKRHCCRTISRMPYRRKTLIGAKEDRPAGVGLGGGAIALLGAVSSAHWSPAAYTAAMPTLILHRCRYF